MPFDRFSMVRRSGALVMAGALLYGVAACGDDEDDDATSDTSDTTAPAQELEISDVWARTSAPGQTAGAVYMVISGGDEGDVLRSASVDASVACETQVHETVPADEAGDDMGEDMGGDATTTTMAGGDMGGDATTTTMAGDDMGEEGEEDMGSMTMREVDAIDVPAGEAVALEPGGYHVMLLGLEKPLVTGDTFDIELTFENAGPVTVTAEVRDR